MALAPHTGVPGVAGAAAGLGLTLTGMPPPPSCCRPPSVVRDWSTVSCSRRGHQSWVTSMTQIWSQTWTCLATCLAPPAGSLNQQQRQLQPGLGATGAAGRQGQAAAGGLLLRVQVQAGVGRGADRHAHHPEHSSSSSL